MSFDYTRYIDDTDLGDASMGHDDPLILAYCEALKDAIEGIPGARFVTVRPVVGGHRSEGPQLQGDYTDEHAAAVDAAEAAAWASFCAGRIGETRAV